jgi:hypothetical protein
MARTWSATITPKASAWNVPTAELAALDGLAGTAAGILDKAQSAERTSIVTAQCKTAFDALIEKMRFIKNHFLLVPPLTDSDLVSLGLKPKDTIRTPVPPPSEQAEADILRPGVHLLELILRVSGGGPLRNGVGFRVYWGVMPHGGADLSAAASNKRELMNVPVSGEALPFSRFTKRKRERFDFDAADSGKTAYFCIRLENAKGEPGPWGALFSAVIP